jgi:hypothetical protein
MTGGRPWSEQDIAKLKSMAGRRPAKDIAVALGRSVEATVVAASKLKLSLRTRFHFWSDRFRQRAEPFSQRARGDFPRKLSQRDVHIQKIARGDSFIG